MKTKIKPMMVVSVFVAAFIAGCASEKEVSMSALSAQARVTIERLTKGGAVDRIDREVEHGKVVYDVEATVAGKHVEYLVADANGEVLGTEKEIGFDQLPELVRAAATKYFGTNSGLKAMEGIEYGEIHYEVEGLRNGKTVEVTFYSTGKRAK
jgi:uncharacterized membrane protein YkoI